MIRWITQSLGTAPATSPELSNEMARVDVRDLVDKAGNRPEAVRRKIDEGAALLAAGRQVVICCDYGISRSNAVAAGTLAISDGIPLSAAVRRVVEATGEREIKLEPLSVVRDALGEGTTRSKSSRPRVLITGGSGFIGSHLANALRGQVESLTCVGSEVDLTGGATELGLLVMEEGVDQVVHLANPRVYTSNRALGDALTMLRNVVDVCRSSGARLVFLSSWEVYSGYRAAEIVADESLPHLPKGPYAEAKVLSEALVAHHRSHHGLEANVVRSAPVYGEGSDKPKFLFNFARTAVLGGGVIRTHRYQNAEPMLDLLAVDDLVSALTAVVTQQPAGDFNLGGGRLWPTTEIAQTLSSLAGGTVTVEQQSIADDVGNVLMHSERARSVLGWQPSGSLSDYLPGVLETAASEPIGSTRGESQCRT